MQTVLFAIPPRRLNKTRAESITGSLGKPSKMPGLAYGISAKKCNVGGKLALIPGSVCADCYAMRDNYSYPSVQAAHEKRFSGLSSISWADSMVFLIRRSGETYFRWHDAGDLQSFQHLLDIVRIAESLPSVAFWLPTKEKGLVYRYREVFGDFPPNLCVRLSGAMVDGNPPAYEGNTSTVHKANAPIGSECEAYTRGGKCGECRDCWNRDIKNVSYPKH
jgi:hypothetical protein